MENKKIKIKPEGIIFFPARDGSPDFVKSKMLITPKVFIAWAKTMIEHASDYKGDKQLKFDLLHGDYGYYLGLDTWKPDPNANKGAATLITPVDKEEEDDLPF